MSVLNNETKLQELLKRLASLPPKILGEVRKKTAEKSPFLFALLYLSHHLTKKTSDFHKELYGVVGMDRVAIAAPRSFAKSTVFSFIYPLWCLVYGKKRDILLVSATGSLAEECLRKIKSELETNELIFKDFGDSQSTKWTEAHIILKNGCQARAKGAGYQIRGFRPDCVVVDDIENDESVRSEEQRQKLDDWFWTALVNTLEPTSQLLVVGTLLHPLSFLTKLIDHPKVGWWTKKYKAIKDDGTPLWAEKWSIEKLMVRKEEIGEKRFRSEYMNDPLADSDVVFDKKWLDENVVLAPPKRAEMDIVVTAVDPAISKKDISDYTAIVTVGKHKETGEIYVLEAKRGRWSVYETVDEIMRTFGRFKSRKVIIEEVAYQAALKEVTIKEARAKGLYLPIRAVKVDVDKVRRAKNISHMIETGAVKFLVGEETLLEEMALFPNADHDDLTDALVHALGEITGGEASVKTPCKIEMRPQVSIFNLDRATRARKHKAWYNH